MRTEQNIEELFREQFAQFEADVNPALWQQIEQAIQPQAAPAPDAGLAANTLAKSAWIKYAAITAFTAVTATAVYYIADNASTKETPETNKTETTVSNQVPQPELLSHVQQETPEVKEEPAIAQSKAESSPQTERQVSEKQTQSAPVSAVPSHKQETTQGNQVVANTNTPPAKTTQVPVVESKNETKENTQGAEKQTSHAEFSPDVEVHALEGYDNLTVAYSIEGELESVSWHFGDGASSSQTHGIYHYSTPGKYTIKVVARSLAGKSKTIQKDIHLTPVSSVDFIPNVFTPNNDGQNDSFVIKVNHAKVYRLTIFDKQGQLVFESNNAEEAWNGLDKSGQPCAVGTYTYVLKVIGIDEKEHSKSGTVKLLR